MMKGALPLLGHALKFARDRGALFAQAHQQLGKVFSLRLGPKKAAVLVGPEYHTLFFKETDRSLNMSLPYRFLQPIVGEVAFVASHATYLNQRPVLYSPFQREKMLRYIDIMDQTVRRWLGTLPDEGRLELTEAMNKLVQEVAGRAILGDDFMTRAGKSFWQNYTLIGKALDPLLPSHWPLPKFIRRDKARKRMLDTLRPILQERRDHPAAFDDFLQDFLNTPNADGSIPSDEDLLGMIIALLFAGHETTAGQAAWTIVQILQHPDYKAKVEHELATLFPHGARIDAKSMAQLPHIRWAIDETTRMNPSADIMIRVTDAPLQVGEYEIPAGWPVFITAEVAQMLPEVFENPNQYDPERFSPARNHHKEHKNAIIGFGGGIHKCPGMSFAQNEMLAIVALFFQQFELELETKNPSIRRDLGANRPSETWLRFKRRPISSGISQQAMEAAAAAGCPHMAKLLAQQPAEPSPQKQETHP